MAEVRKPTAGQHIIKKRNVRLALNALAATGLDLTALSASTGNAGDTASISVENVVSGHSKEVLALLWAVAKASLDKLLPLAQLRTEVSIVERKLALKGIQTGALESLILPGNSTPVTLLLLRWVRAVCGLYGVTIRSCRSSFTDGSALCLLVHHYVPSLVSWTAISTPAPLPREAAEELLGAGALQGVQSLSWCDHQGMQNSIVDSELEEHRCDPGRPGCHNRARMPSQFVVVILS